MACSTGNPIPLQLHFVKMGVKLGSNFLVVPTQLVSQSTMSHCARVALLCVQIWLFIASAVCVLQIDDCEVVIAGGSTAAFAAAVASASQGVQTCLLEPTDWVGGQLTASGVPAVDFEWRILKSGDRQYNIARIDKLRENVTPNFYSLLRAVGDMGRCWVSNYCFLPRDVINKGLLPLQRQVSQFLRVFENTLVKRVKVENGRVLSLDAVQRVVKPGTKCNGYDQLLSDAVSDWYSETESARFTKKILQFGGTNLPIFMDATDWGDILALSNMDYLQALSEQFDGDTSGKGNDTCGQSTVFGFAEYLAEKNHTEPENPYPVHYPDYYNLERFTWNQVWTYRRLENPKASPDPSALDVTLQNWGRGNDYAFGYLFKPRDDARIDVSRDAWAGGLNLNALREAEYLAYGWHYAYKKMNHTLASRVVLLQEQIFGTCHGLSKMPYIRDTRRSIGLDRFVMKISDLTGDWTKGQLTGTVYEDRVALGSYPCDIHSLVGCKYPPYIHQANQTLPYYIPFRALTHYGLSNLLVAGKTMAQSFLSNAATRLHPVEWSSGTAAGVSAAFMVKNKLQTTRQLLEEHMKSVQQVISQYTPIQWTITTQ